MKTTVLPLSRCYEVVITEDDGDQELIRYCRSKVFQWLWMAEKMLSEACGALHDGDPLNGMVNCCASSVREAVKKMKELREEGQA